MHGPIVSHSRARRATRISFLAVAAALGWAAASPTALAQQARTDEDTVVVTGTALATKYEKIGNSLTVIGSEQIESGGYTYVPDVLRQVPGLAVSKTGPSGGLTQVRTRGAEGNHTIVLFNGVDVSDAGNGETDLSTLMSANTDRIEVLRGPQSGLYGSNALAGVINVLTRKNVDGLYYNGAAEYGSFNTTTLTGGGGWGDGKTYVDGGVALLKTDGYDVSADGTAASLGNAFGAPGTNGDKEGNENGTGYVAGGVEVSPMLRFDGFARYVATHAELDGQDFSGIPGAQGHTVDDNSETFTHTYNVAGSGTLSLMDNKWVTVASANYTRNHAEGKDGVSFDAYGDKAWRSKFALQSSYRFGADGFISTLTGFVEDKKEWYQNTHPFSPAGGEPHDRTLIGYGVQYQAEIANQLYLSGTLRRDDNDRFDDDTTGGVAASWVLHGSGTRLHASYGTGVTNPSFFEQFGFDPAFGFIGNPDLKPEKAWGYDAGVEQTFLEGRAVADITYFRSRLTDEIISTFNATAGLSSTGNSNGKSNREGVEVSAKVYPTDDIDLIGSYTYLDAKEGNPPTIEVRRPKNQAALDANWRLMNSALQLTVGITYNGEQYDNSFFTGFSAVKTRQDAYTVARLGASYKLTPTIELFGRVENLFDEEYEEVIGYRAAKRAGYIGIRFKEDTTRK